MARVQTAKIVGIKFDRQILVDVRLEKSGFVIPDVRMSYPYLSGTGSEGEKFSISEGDRVLVIFLGPGYREGYVIRFLNNTYDAVIPSSDDEMLVKKGNFSLEVDSDKLEIKFGNSVLRIKSDGTIEAGDDGGPFKKLVNEDGAGKYNTHTHNGAVGAPIITEQITSSEMTSNLKGE